jgi:hypothetical protein
MEYPSEIGLKSEQTSPWEWVVWGCLARGASCYSWFLGIVREATSLPLPPAGRQVGMYQVHHCRKRKKTVTNYLLISPAIDACFILVVAEAIPALLHTPRSDVLNPTPPCCSVLLVTVSTLADRWPDFLVAIAAAARYHALLPHHLAGGCPVNVGRIGVAHVEAHAKGDVTLFYHGAILVSWTVCPEHEGLI